MQRSDAGDDRGRALDRATGAGGSACSTSATSILHSLARFWGRITIDADPTFDGQDVSDDDIQSGASALFDRLLGVMVEMETLLSSRSDDGVSLPKGQ